MINEVKVTFPHSLLHQLAQILTAFEQAHQCLRQKRNEALKLKKFPCFILTVDFRSISHMFKTGSLEHTEQTFLCKSSRGLVSQNPVLAMVTAEDRGLMHGRCSYLSTGVDGGLEQSRAARTAINKDR